MAWRSASGSPGGTSNPVTFRSFTSRTPVGSAVEITALPEAIASISTMPNISAGEMLGSTR